MVVEMWFVFVDMHLFKLLFVVWISLLENKIGRYKKTMYVQVYNKNIMCAMRRWPANAIYILTMLYIGVTYRLLVGDTELTCDIDCALRLRWKRDCSISKMYNILHWIVLWWTFFFFFASKTMSYKHKYDRYL